MENYLFDNVSENFQTRGYLTPEEFFAIVIWKRNASKTKILSGIKEDGRSVKTITSDIFLAETREQKMSVLLNPKIPGISISFASAILTVCYPENFTIVDYRACATLENFNVKVKGNPTIEIIAYFDYLDKCKKLAIDNNFSLRDFDRILWAKDFYEGENGLKNLVDGLD